MNNILLNPWSNFWSFIKNPKDQKDTNQTTGNRFKQLFSILVLDVILVSIAAFLISVAEEAGFISTESHIMNELMYSSSKWYILFIGVVLAPVFEEIIFRLYLRKRYNPIQLISLVGGAVKPSAHNSLKLSIDKYWHKYYKGFFYFAALVFGVVNIFNYELSLSVLIFTPLLISPQFIAGLFMGYLRVRFGLLWGMLLHMLHNHLFVGLGLMFMQEPIQSFSVQNDRFQLTVEANGFNHSTSKINALNNDTVVYENVKFKRMMSKLLKVEEASINIKPERLRLQNINLKFFSISENIDYENLVINELKHKFNFNILKNTEIKDAWRVSIADKIKLYQHQSSSQYSSTTVNLTHLELEKVSLHQLAETLNSNYDEFIFNALEFEEDFDFVFDKKDFKSLKTALMEDYGLELEKTSKEIEQVIIDFED